MKSVAVDIPLEATTDTDSDLEWVEATVLRERPLGEAISSYTQTDGRISHLHPVLRLRPDARWFGFRGAPLRSAVLPGSRCAL